MDEVAPGVFVATADLYATTTTVIAGPDGRCLVIDPAVTPPELGTLARWLSASGLVPVAGWSTHPHWDHLLWSAALGDVPRYATPRAVGEVAREQAGLLAGVQESAPGHDLTLFAQVQPMAGEEMAWAGPRAVIVAHNAHAPGHGAVFLPEAGVLIAGDMCSDIEIPLLDPNAADPFGDYRLGLGLLARVPGVTVIVPGHGRVGDRAEFRRRVAADFAYLDTLETGTDPADPRLSAAWLRTEHARQLALAVSLSAGR